jgi:hypothetical protein
MADLPPPSRHDVNLPAPSRPKLNRPLPMVAPPVAVPAAAPGSGMVQARLVQLEMPHGPEAIQRLGQSVIQVTDAWFTVDVFQPQPATMPFVKAPPRTTQRVVQIPIAHVREVDIEGQADHARGFSTAGALTFGVAGGVFGSNRRVRGVTRFVVVTDHGWMMLNPRGAQQRPSEHGFDRCCKVCPKRGHSWRPPSRLPVGQAEVFMSLSPRPSWKRS